MIKTDYTEEIEMFLENNFQPVNDQTLIDDNTKIYELKQVMKFALSIFPSDFVSQSDVYNALENTGFKVSRVDVDEVVDEDGEVLKPAYTKFAYLMQPIGPDAH